MPTSFLSGEKREVIPEWEEEASGMGVIKKIKRRRFSMNTFSFTSFF
jgi:hypothetical protein